MTDRLAEYRRKRDAARTPEPIPDKSDKSDGEEAGAGSAEEAPGKATRVDSAGRARGKGNAEGAPGKAAGAGSAEGSRGRATRADSAEKARGKGSAEGAPDKATSAGRARGKGGGRGKAGGEEPTGGRFVIQQHHARSLHWDVRLERDGVLVSFAVPRGLPRDQHRNNLAKHTEDHPLEYLSFSGEIPAGEYGGGRMTIFDSGTYETDKWRDDEIGVTFHGDRTSGRYVFFQTGGNDWMVRRMDPPEPGWETMPEVVPPMLATRAAHLPGEDAEWGYEMAWGGRRVIAYVSGGRVRLLDADGNDVTSWYPEIRPLGPQLAPIEAVIDGEVVAFAEARPDPALLERRRQPKDSAAARRAAERTPVHFLAYDLLWLEGHSTVEAVRYAERRELLEGLAVNGDNWQTPPYFPGGGEFALEAAAAQGLAGVVAKRLDSPYLPGRRSRLWLTISSDAE